MYGNHSYYLNREEKENYRVTEVQRKSITFCLWICHSWNNPVKWCLLTPLQIVTGRHSSLSLHNQSFLSTRRLRIHAGFCTVRQASCCPTLHSITPTQRKKVKHDKTGYAPWLLKTLSPGLLSCLSVHVHSQLWWHLHICNMFINNNNQKK